MCGVSLFSISTNLLALTILFLPFPVSTHHFFADQEQVIISTFDKVCLLGLFANSEEGEVQPMSQFIFESPMRYSLDLL